MIFTNLILTNLRTQYLGKNIEYYQRLESTNTEAWELLNNNQAKHGMMVITDNQLKGKGRNGNTWFMGPSKGLALSLILTKPIEFKDAILLPLAAGVAAARTLDNRGSQAQLKWPNDIIINEKKCGGILCESKISKGIVTSMVIGIGMNINEREKDFPENLIQSSTSLYLETGYSHQRELISAIFTTFFETIIDDLPSVTKQWENYCNHLEKNVSFTQEGIKYNGPFKGIHNNGQALIEINKDIKKFSSIVLE
ncbi:MAG: biotin--[acetyl-CoA-carboxylase] ligase [Candidatus Neomarinimicrobiota bacterium]